MNLFNNDLMKLLDSLMPKEQYIIEKEGYAKGCGCEVLASVENRHYGSGEFNQK